MTAALFGDRIGQTIYTGTKTLVYRGQRKPNCQRVAIKLLRNEYPTFAELLQLDDRHTINSNPAEIRSKFCHTKSGLIISNCRAGCRDQAVPISVNLTSTLFRDCWWNL
jgi:hypothetical protein